MQIPAEALTAIEAVIVNDEGGWKLTANPNDPDGGWTYAGITAKTWNEYIKNKPDHTLYLAYSFDVMQKQINSEVGEIESLVHEIYYFSYYLPLQKAEHTVSSIMLSCAINCGVNTAIEILDAAVDHENTFAHQWLLHYADLVRKNAEAWRDYAIAVEGAQSKGYFSRVMEIPDKEKPKTLRAEFLAGWINRVEKYR